MPQKIKRFEGDSSTLDKMVKAGWLRFWKFDAQKKIYDFEWTDKGLDRRKWVEIIDEEMQMDLETSDDLFSLCRGLKQQRDERDSR